MILLTAAAFAQPVLTIDLPSCPGVATVTIDGATPGGRVGLVAAEASGSFVPPAGPCAGGEALDLDAGSARVLTVVTVDGSGSRSLTPNIKERFCGQRVVALDLTTCAPSAAACTEDEDGDGVCTLEDPCPLDNPDDPDGDGECGVAAGPKRVFVTSSVHDGDLSEEGPTMIEGGDAICNARAYEASLGGTYIAWLSDDTTDAVDRLTPGSGPFLLTLYDQVIAADIADLTDGNLTAPWNRDENGQPVSGAAWTGTLADGNRSVGDNCAQWNAAFDIFNGLVGDVGAIDGTWTNQTTSACQGTVARLYCVEI